MLRLIRIGKNTKLKGLQTALKSRSVGFRVKNRLIKDKIMRRFSLFVSLISSSILIFIMVSTISKSYYALYALKVNLEISVGQNIDPRASINYTRTYSKELIYKGVMRLSRQVFDDPNLLKTSELLALNASDELVDMFKEKKIVPGSNNSIWITASSAIHAIDEYNASNKEMLYVLKKLKKEGKIKKFFNANAFVNGDSESPKHAGVLGAIMGTCMVIGIFMMISVPTGIMAAAYISEIISNKMVKNFYEVCISNMAAVPSIVFGLLGFALYLSFFGVPRSSALAGGLTISTMMLPSIIVSSISALEQTPKKIKYAAFALGASKMQVVIHHTLPLAFPILLRGILNSVTKAAAESSPMILIGMVAFVSDVAKGIMDPTTVLPVQIYIWTSSPENELIELASLAILILLAMLFTFNRVVVMTGSYIHKKFEH